MPEWIDAYHRQTCRQKKTAELRIPAQKYGIDIIRLVTPTTDEKRLSAILNGAGGFLYYVSVTGITLAANEGERRTRAPARWTAIRKHSALPVAVGFGRFRRRNKRRNIAACADAVVVGSAIVKRIADNLDAQITRHKTQGLM